MRLTDLDPRWLEHEGRRIGFVFKSPTNPRFWQTCMLRPIERRVQREAIMAMFPNEPDRAYVQMCKPGTKWAISTDDFATMSVTPSLDGSAGGLWHGFITEGKIVGGL